MKFLAVLAITGLVAAIPAPQAAACDPAVQNLLVQGIQQNIDIQGQELLGIMNLQTIVNQAAQASNSTGAANVTASANGTAAASSASIPNVNIASFSQAQLDLLNIQQNGINVRNNNQKLAQQLGSPSAVGLVQFSMVQVNEMKAVMSLTAGDNDINLLGQLQQSVQNGIMQNNINLQVAQSQKC